jgi:hypothetical protein
LKSKFHVDYIQALVAVFLFRTFYIPVFCITVYHIKIYRAIILPVVLYGCVTWSLALREERRLMVFEKRVLWKIFGIEWQELKRG